MKHQELARGLIMAARTMSPERLAAVVRSVDDGTVGLADWIRGVGDCLALSELPTSDEGQVTP